MGQSAGKWADNDQDLLGFNFPLIQAACAFAVLQFFVPFMGLIASILCICVFGKYKSYASVPNAYNVLIAMAILALIFFVVGEGMWIAGYAILSGCIYNALYYNSGSLYYATQVLNCTEATATLTAIGWVLTVIGLAMAITECVFIFDLHNSILRVRNGGGGTQVVIVTQQQPQQQQQVVTQTTTVQQPGMVYASPVMGQPMMVQQPVYQPPMMVQPGQPVYQPATY